ncbi:hypothetical protein FA13DRAFT_829803 [Coprinellus micaceus]|uniref:Uncharacterized protein n=1 Tax=Coprinellus micaceus TaxID=71717 RepID=A0A4Y7T2B2_COPMI|nr:hypothetical protein FA13DRAFT_829803 [Coprinellus micaceus]
MKSVLTPESTISGIGSNGRLSSRKFNGMHWSEGMSQPSLFCPRLLGSRHRPLPRSPRLRFPALDLLSFHVTAPSPPRPPPCLLPATASSSFLSACRIRTFHSQQDVH